MKATYLNSIDKKYNMLTCLSLYEKTSKIPYMYFKCDCGNVKILNLDNVKRGLSKSCGCLVSERAKIGLHKKHNFAKTRFYNIFNSIKTRCTNPNATGFDTWGGRGIKCLWESFEDFKDEMYESYLDHVEKFGEKQTTIDRIDNDSGYYKQNCRWATYKVQANNRRNNKKIYV